MIRRHAVTLLSLIVSFAILSTASAQNAGTYTGTIDDASPRVQIDIPAIAEGDTITVDAQAASGDLDLIVGLFYENGLWAGESDDREPGNPNPYLVYENAPAGDYMLLVTRYGLEDGETSGDFIVTVDVKSGSTPLTTITPEMIIDTEAAGYPTVNPAPQADWTVLAYLGGDNNLEAGLIHDLDELERAGGSSESVRVVALLDRAADFDTSNGDTTDARVYEVGPDKSADAAFRYPPTIDSDVLAYLGEIDMGQDITFLNFLIWGLRTYPSDHVAIELNDHGGGWAGTVWDDSSAEQANLTLPKMAAVFRRALQETGRERFDLLINDSCLMSSIENFAALQPYFDYAYSSPEVMNNPGFDLTLLVETLNQQPDIDLGTLGQMLSDQYMQDMQLGFPGIATYLGAAVTDLRQFPKLVNALSAFTRFVMAKPESFTSLLGRARANAYTYSAWSQLYEEVDLGDLMRRIARSRADVDLQTAAQNVLDAMDDAIVYSTSGDLLSQETSYYNIYFPIGGSAFNVRYLQQSPLTGWADMLRVYYTTLETDSSEFGADVASTVPDVRITNVFPVDASVYAPVSVSMEVVGNNISHGDFTADQVQPDGSAIRLTQARILTTFVRDDGTVEQLNFWHPGVDDFRFTWNAEVPFVSDGASSFPERVVISGGIWSLSGQYTYPGSADPIDVDILFDDTGAFSAMISRQRESAGFANIQPDAGGLFQAYRVRVAPDGQGEVELGNQYTWPEAGLTVSEEPAPSGPYNLGFLIQGFDGEVGFNATSVQVNHDTINPDYQGYVDTDWGLNFLYPSDWTGIVYYPDLGWESANDASGQRFVYVYPVDPSGSDPAAIAEETMAQYGVDITPGSLETTTVAGRPAVSFSYEWTVESGATFNGRGFAFYQPALDLGFVISSETTDGSDPSQVFQVLRDSLVLFDPVEVNARDTGKWTTESISDLANYPVLEDWTPGFDNDGWRTYYEDGVEGSLAYLSVTERPGTNASDVLADLLVEYFGNASDVQTSQESTYYGEVNTWEQVVFNYPASDGTPIIGAIYVLIDQGKAHIVWLQMPEERAGQVAGNLFVTLNGYTLADAN